MKRLSFIFLSTLLLATFLLAGCGSKPASSEPTPTMDPATPAPAITPLPTPVITAAPAPTPLNFPTMGYCNGEGVNLRSEPDKSATIVDIMGENVVLEIVSLHDDWYRVNLDGETAYVSEKLVTLGDPPRKHNMHWAKVTASSAKLYKDTAGKDASTVTLKKGEVVKVLRKIGDYLHVVYQKNLQRYIKASAVEYITEEEFNGASPTPSATAKPAATLEPA